MRRVVVEIVRGMPSGRDTCAGGGVLLVPQGRRERRRGLLAIGPLPRGHLLLLERARVVHTVGVRGRVAVAFVDAGMRIVAVRRVRPGRVAGPVRGARHVVEAAEGSDLRAGDAVQLVGAPSDADPTRRAYFASAPVV